MTIRIYTTGGRRIGLGHVYRAETVADALRARGLEVELADLRVWEDLDSPDVAIRDLPSGDTAPRGRALTVDIVDERHEASPEADIVIPVFDDVRFATIREPILRASLALGTPRNLVAVSLGGVDPTESSMGVYASAREGVTEAGVEGIEARLVTGPGSPWGQSKTTLEGVLPRSLVVVTSCGMTMLEAGFHGAAVLACAANERERKRLERLHHTLPWVFYCGTLYGDSDAREYTLGNVRSWVSRLLTSPDELARVSALARSRIDGRGAERIATLVAEGMGAEFEEGVGGSSSEYPSLETGTSRFPAPVG